MQIARFTFISLLNASAAYAAGTHVPSDPSGCDQDLLEMAVPTKDCPGGSIASLSKNMALSRPLGLAEFSQTVQRDHLSGTFPTDQARRFYFRSELPGGSFWGFSGYVLERRGCIVHVKITSRDN